MTLYFIGLGLDSEKDITVKGLEAVRKCDALYLEGYTSVLNCSREDLERFYGKKINFAGRGLVEDDNNEILPSSKSKNIGFLVIGDPLVATTHMDLFLRARKEGIKTVIIHNSSIASAIGMTGLQVYKFGRITSIPAENENVTAPYEALRDNLKLGLHTLFLLDMNPEKNTFLGVNDAIRFLLKAEIGENGKIFNEKTLCLGCTAIGSDRQMVKYDMAGNLLKVDFGKPPQILIVPGKLHFMEEEALRMWSPN